MVPLIKFFHDVRQIINVNNNRKVLTDLCLPDHTIIGAKVLLTKCLLVVTMLSDVQDLGWQIIVFTLLFAGHLMAELALMIPLITAVRLATICKIFQSWGAR
jgi:hypothetical protein